MLILDTSAAIAAIALATRQGQLWIIAAQESFSGRTASERLIPLLRRMFETAGQTVLDLVAVAVVHGPGSFTGIRVGVSAAKALCEAGSLPLIAISQLAALASIAPDVIPGTLVHSVLDAGRSELFHGAYNFGICETEDLLSSRDLFARLATDPGTLVFCEETLADQLRPLGARFVPRPSASDLLALASLRLASGDLDDPALLDANYLRHTEDEIRRRVADHLALRPANRPSL